MLRESAAVNTWFCREKAVQNCMASRFIFYSICQIH